MKRGGTDTGFGSNSPFMNNRTSSLNSYSSKPSPTSSNSFGGTTSATPVQ